MRHAGADVWIGSAAGGAGSRRMRREPRGFRSGARGKDYRCGRAARSRAAGGQHGRLRRPARLSSTSPTWWPSAPQRRYRRQPRAQHYIVGKLQGFGCPVDQRIFMRPTPIGNVAMKNIVAKIPGASPISCSSPRTTTASSCRTLWAPTTGVPRPACAGDGAPGLRAKNALTFWIAFFDGEEAFNPDWMDPDNTYGSRELAARMALSGDLRAREGFVLVDMVGGRNLQIKRRNRTRLPG